MGAILGNSTFSAKGILRGDVVIVDCKLTEPDATEGKLRPVLVVRGNRWKNGSTLYVCEIKTKANEAYFTNVYVNEGGTIGYIVTQNIIAIRDVDIIRKVNTLSPEIMKKVDLGLSSVLGLDSKEKSGLTDEAVVEEADLSSNDYYISKISEKISRLLQLKKNYILAKDTVTSDVVLNPLKSDVSCILPEKLCEDIKKQVGETARKILKSIEVEIDQELASVKPEVIKNKVVKGHSTKKIKLTKKQLEKVIENNLTRLEAAKELKVSTSTLDRNLKKYNLKLTRKERECKND